MLRRVIYIVGGATVLFGNFFITLWFTEPNIAARPPKAADTRSDTERLAAQHISNYEELTDAAANVGHQFSRELKGVVGGVSRLNERPHIIVFIGGSAVANAQTNGERPDVTRVIGLGFGAEKNVAFSFKFNCSPGVLPVVVGVGEKEQYIPLEPKKCPCQCNHILDAVG